ncbi:hypothetical protein TNCV_1737361 [Trichonephila clavipes]|nr:hypothetical protein TNCV_1737361 [Trichonephila clavipes]
MEVQWQSDSVSCFPATGPGFKSRVGSTFYFFLYSRHPFNLDRRTTPQGQGHEGERKEDYTFFRQEFYV